MLLARYWQLPPILLYHVKCISIHINSFPDAEDESLQRYKASLGLSTGPTISDPSDPRQCIILSLTMDSEGRPPVTIDLSQKGAESTLKDKPFKIKEGSKFTMIAKFKVQHEVLSGLQYVQIVKRKGIRVSKDQEMIVSRRHATDQATRLEFGRQYCKDSNRAIGKLPT
jgi:hypothetical protein